ncbi:hypothetical protein [Amycolatopsis jejuensis]|uniref:hypothetical protein n=1 Tax=Amycolatopsis jejuensis TaxID=330084 RepID=UPI0012DFF163|nr:hypothetical protein [Amycolatopsis jejuensis]
MTVPLHERLAALDPERARYLLDSLAPHLAAAGDHDRLRRLFAGDEWMQARFAADHPGYDGYLADLSLAWDIAQQAVEVAPDTALADCVRYALIWTSINSLSRNVAVELAVRAIEDGAMGPSQAFSIAQRVPDPRQRVRFVARLLAAGALDPQQQKAARRVGLDAVHAVEPAHRAEALDLLASHLDGELAAEALQAARSVDLRGKALALVAVAPLLDDGRQPVAIEALPAIGASIRSRKLELWSRAVGCLDRAHLEQALQHARATTDPEERGYALIALAERDVEPQLFTEALSAFRALRSNYHLAEALAATIDRFSEPIRQDVATLTLETALGLDVNYHYPETDFAQLTALTAAVPFLTGDDLDRAIETARAIPAVDSYREARAKLFTALAQRLTDDRRATLRQIALETARSTDGSWELPSLLVVAPLLDEDERAAAMRAALDRALSSRPDMADLGWHLPRLKELGEVTPYLGRDQLETALDSLRVIDDHDARAIGLAALSPLLGAEAHRKVAGFALNAVKTVQDENTRQRAFSVVAPTLPVEFRREARQIANDIEDVDHRRWALAAIPSWSPAVVTARAVTMVEGRGRRKRVAPPLSPDSVDDVAFDADPAQLRATLLPLMTTMVEEDLRSWTIRGEDSYVVTFLSSGVDPELAESRRRLGTHLPPDPAGTAEVRLAASDFLRWTRQRQRADVLRSLALPVFGPPFVSPEMADTTAKTIMEICWEWDWR